MSEMFTFDWPGVFTAHYGQGQLGEDLIKLRSSKANYTRNLSPRGALVRLEVL